MQSSTPNVRSAPAGIAIPIVEWGASAALRLGFATPWAQALWITLIFTAVRVLSIPFVGLGTDEAYTIAVSHEWSLSYFDHPPLHQWLVHAAADLLGWGRALRLPFVAMAAATSWLMFRLTAALFGEKAGVWAVLVLNLAGFFSVAAGTWVLPDGPLDLCLTAAALALCKVFFPEPGRAPQATWTDWLKAGVWIGLAGLSKYQALLFCAGLGLFIVSSPSQRRWLRDPAAWTAGALSIALISPVVGWNADHGWASFVFQAGRGGAKHGLRPLQSVVSVLGQVALLLPWVFVPLALAAGRAVRAGRAQPRRWFCLMLAAPSIVLFSLTPMWGDRSLPHWPMPGWLLILPLAGDLLARAATTRRWPALWAAASTFALAVLWTAFAAEAATGALGRAFPGLRADPTVETVAWTGLREQVSRRLAAPSQCLFVASTSWIDAGKIASAVGDLVPVRVLSADPRGFAFLHARTGPVGCDALIVERSAGGHGRLEAVRPYFASIRPLATDVEGRGSREVELTVLDARRMLRPFPQPYN